MKKRIKIQGLFIFLAVFLFFLFYQYLLPRTRNIFLECLGIFFLICGYVLRIAARGCKAELNPDGKTLVCSGPYALTRNPMYLGTLLIGLGVISALFYWWVGIFFLVVYLIIYIPQINQEEEVLSKRFQRAFLEYKKSTPKFFPDILILFKINPFACLKIKKAWVKKELVSFLMTLFFVFSIKIWIFLKR